MQTVAEWLQTPCKAQHSHHHPGDTPGKPRAAGASGGNMDTQTNTHTHTHTASQTQANNLSYSLLCVCLCVWVCVNIGNCVCVYVCVCVCVLHVCDACATPGARLPCSRFPGYPTHGRSPRPRALLPDIGCTSL